MPFVQERLPVGEVAFLASIKGGWGVRGVDASDGAGWLNWRPGRRQSRELRVLPIPDRRPVKSCRCIKGGVPVYHLFNVHHIARW